MLTADEVLNLNYYKKTSYTGWINGMRFLIKREAPEEGDAIFHAWVWPGPLIFDLVDDTQKYDFTAPLPTEENSRLLTGSMRSTKIIRICGHTSANQCIPSNHLPGHLSHYSKGIRRYDFSYIRMPFPIHRFIVPS